jgi:hypothetical protein
MKAAAISSLFVVSLAFAITTFPDYPVKHAKECLITVEKTGISVGLEPVDNTQAQQTYFGTSLTKKRFVPVFVVIENGDGSNSLLFDKTKVTYGAALALTAAQTGSGFVKSAALSAIPFFGHFAAAQTISNASQIQSNLIRKELQSTTLPPGTSAHGFLYVPSVNSPRGKIAISNNVGGVKQFSSTLQHALEEERHFALMGGLRFPTWARF